MRARRRGETVYYYYDTGGKPRHEIPLGTDYITAVQEWAKLHQSQPTAAMTVAWLIGKYLVSPAFNDLGTGTQADYKFALDKIMAAFGDAPIDQVKPSHVVLYIEKRTATSKHRALREKSVLSMLFNWAIEREFAKFNPAGVVKTKRLPGRKHVYISDDMLDAVYTQAPQDLRDAIDLAYYIGQRPADLLTMTLVKIRDGFLEYRQGKTTTPQRIAINDDLGALLKRIEDRKAQYQVHSLYLLVNERGQKMTRAMLRSRFEAARSAAGITGDAFQFRDLRRKSGSDLRDQAGLDAAQDLLGHASQAMTEHYTAARGKKISAIPRKRSNSNG
jgi:integrase